MNKKFLIGLSAAAVATTFMACGSGDVYELSNADLGVQITYIGDANDSNLIGLKNNAITACESDPACAVKMGGSPTTNPTPASSAVETPLPNDPVNPNPIAQSSSSFMPTLTSSSSIQFNPASSSDDEEPVNVPTGEFKLGTCAPVVSGKEVTTINKGESVQWKFTLNTANTGGVTGIDILDATFTWDFGTMGAGATSGSSQTSSAVKYANSGLATTTLKASFKGGLVAENITCAPLQVNGAPITGCKCTAVSPTADVADGGIAGWTVTGCTSAGQTITGYEWTKATGAGESASYTFTEKGQTLAPTVKVSNDDNTVQAFTCDEVKAVDASSPDYLFTAQGNDAAIAFEGDVDATLVFDLPSNWHNDNNAGTCSFVCTVQRGTSGDGKITGTIGEEKIAGGDYVTTTISTAITVGKTSVPFKLSVGGNAGATCSLAW